MFATWAQRLLVAAGLLMICGAATSLAQQPNAEVNSDADVSLDPPAADAEQEGMHTDEHADHAHEAHIGAPETVAGPDEIKGDLAVWTFVVFLLLLGILWRFAWGPIVAGLEKREHRIAENIAAAERSNAEAKRLLGDYERKLAASQDEVRAIIDEARRDAEHTQQEILAKARLDAQAERDRSLREIETARDQALKDLGERSANLAVDLAGKIVRAQLNPADHTRLIEEAMARFPQGAPSKN